MILVPFFEIPYRERLAISLFVVIWIRRKIFDGKIAEKISRKIEELERIIEESELETLHEHTEDELESKREKVEANPSEEEQKSWNIDRLK